MSQYLNNIQLRKNKRRQSQQFQSIDKQLQMCQSCHFHQMQIRKLQASEREHMKAIEIYQINLVNFEKHNQMLEEQIRNIHHKFTEYIEKLQKEIIGRDTLLKEQVAHNHQQEQYIKQLEERENVEFTKFQQQWEEREKQQKKLYDEEIQMKKQEIKQLKQKIKFGDVSDRKIKIYQENQEKNKRDVQELEARIQEKQKLIRYLSNTNDQIRLELMHIKISSDTTLPIKQDEPSILQLQRENQNLRQLVNRLQNQLQQTVVDQAKYLKIISKNNRGSVVSEKSVDGKRGSGSIIKANQLNSSRSPLNESYQRNEQKKNNLFGLLNSVGF